VHATSTSPVSMLRLRGGLAPASGTKGALKVDLSQARKRTARSKGKWTGASRPFASGDSDEDSEDEEPDDSGNEFDKMLAKDEDDDPLSGDVEEIAALSFDEWQARVQAREDKKAIGQRHEDTDYGVGFLEGRFTEDANMGWINYVPLPAPRRPDQMDSEDAPPRLEDLHPRLLDRHLWHYAEIGDMPQVAALLAAGANVSSCNNESYLPAPVAFGVNARDSFVPHDTSETGTYGNVTVSNTTGEASSAVVCVYKWTAVHWAACNGHAQMVELLAEHNASLDAADHDKRTALHWAAAAGFEDVVRILLMRGANVSAEDKSGNSPLHYASWEGRVDMATMLIDAGADVNATNAEELTALHWAAVRGRTEVAGLLLANGIDAWAESGVDSMDAIRMGELAGHEECCDLIAEHMGLEKVPPEDLNSIERKALEIETLARLEVLASEMFQMDTVETGDPSKPLRILRGAKEEAGDPSALEGTFRAEREAVKAALERRLAEHKDVLDRIREVDREREEIVGDHSLGQMWGANHREDGEDFSKKNAMGG